MSIEMRWEGERGDMLEELFDSAHATFSGMVIRGGGSDYVCLRFVDPYGDTIFNQLQIPSLISDLERVLERHNEPELKAHLESMLALARKAKGKHHTYIKFYGD